jgi:hypothetical protein
LADYREIKFKNFNEVTVHKIIALVFKSKSRLKISAHSLQLRATPRSDIKSMRQYTEHGGENVWQNNRSKYGKSVYYKETAEVIR